MSNARLFAEWLMRQQPKYDKLIVEDVRPTEFTFTTTPFPIPDWFRCQELVRRLCEGAAYTPSRKPKPRSEMDHVHNRFFNIYTELK